MIGVRAVRSPARDAVVGQLAEAIRRHAAKAGHPLRVGLDGRSAAGKTTLADELAEALRQRGAHCVRVSIDDFHRPGHKWRSIRGEWTPELRLAEGLDYAGFRELVLEPLGPGGSRRIRPRLFDSYRDEPFPEEWVTVSGTAILVSDAGYGFVPELRERWDYRVWVEVRADVMIERGGERDAGSGAGPGGIEVARARYETFWTACDDLYHGLHCPAESAECIVDNNDLERPVMVRFET